MEKSYFCTNFEYHHYGEEYIDENGEYFDEYGEYFVMNANWLFVMLICKYGMDSAITYGENEFITNYGGNND